MLAVGVCVPVAERASEPALTVVRSPTKALTPPPVLAEMSTELTLIPLTLSAVPVAVAADRGVPAAASPPPRPSTPPVAPEPAPATPTNYSLKEIAKNAAREAERELILQTLQHTRWNRKETAEYGHRCLLARRLVERGVRFVQIYCGGGSQWDAHSDLEGNHSRLCLRSDRPTAALLQDLKARGLLDETLVIWGGEFGRTPMTEGKDGRDHNPHGFSMWLAGGGVKGGQVIGATDEIGLRAAEDRMHVHDLQATILHLLGLNHKRLTFRHNGRNERLTDNGGEVIEKALL